MASGWSRVTMSLSYEMMKCSERTRLQQPVVYVSLVEGHSVPNCAREERKHTPKPFLVRLPLIHPYTFSFILLG